VNVHRSVIEAHAAAKISTVHRLTGPMSNTPTKRGDRGALGKGDEREGPDEIEMLLDRQGPGVPEFPGGLVDEFMV